MPELDDHELLADFAGTHSEAAFATLVARHLNLVYSTALRFTGNSHHAEEITQAVFIILAQKAGKLSSHVVLSGWLYQVARFTTANFLKSEIRRQHREQEAYMQTILNEPDALTWQQIAPLLDEAMGGLGETDRNAIVLRFFENKTAAEAAAQLNLTEAATHKRVNRALEKLRKFFTKRGVSSTTAIIAGTISANSVQAAPVALIKTISVVVAAKGAAAATSTLTLVKGTLKLMAYAKIKLAIGIGAIVLLAGGVVTLALSKWQPLTQSPIEDDSWEVSTLQPLAVAVKILNETKPQVRIVDSKYDHFIGRFTRPYSVKADKSRELTSKTANVSQSIGIGITAREIILTAYESTALETIFPPDMPTNKYDYIANLPQDSLMQLREVIKTKFGLVGKRRMITTNAFALVHTNPDLPVIREPKQLSHFDRLKSWRKMLENTVTQNAPIVDLTGLTNQYEWKFELTVTDATSDEERKHQVLQAFHDQLGLDLIATNMPVEMLVVERVK